MVSPSKQTIDKDIPLKCKYQNLRETVLDMGSVMIAFSGGADSTLLLNIAQAVLGKKVIAITASSEILPSGELEEAKRLAQEMGVEHIVIADELRDEFLANTEERCYLCKRNLYSKLIDLALKREIAQVIDGTNRDDLNDFRPGLRAAKELRIRSPLAEAKLTKEEIRLLSKDLALTTWDKPPQSCLATRLPHGERITIEKLRLVDLAETFLKEIGFAQVRVRLQNDRFAEIEIKDTEIPRLLRDYDRVLGRFKELGLARTILHSADHRKVNAVESSLEEGKIA
ncbi:MAG: ATP-dependent sacrificial sulfur transferase LarE [Actinomycetota bacterium]|nr:ATP-dependent sacrificial sulfur transferase LarE [Actinomycetota bacterium]